MMFESVFEAIEGTALAQAIRASLLLFPLIEAAHVIGLTLVFGTIMVVDLRLLGVASRSRGYTRLADELLKWTWGAFALTVTTGALMFITNATGYAGNIYFRVKMVLLVLAGLNMAVFQFVSAKDVHTWNLAPAAPRSGKIAAILSLTLWISVIVMGRLIGFSLQGQTPEPAPPAGVNFDDFLQ